MRTSTACRAKAVTSILCSSARTGSPAAKASTPTSSTSNARVSGPGRNKRRHMQHKTRGVSLLEMLLVIALLAAISVVAAGAMTGGFAGMQLRSEAKRITAQLRYTRTHAIATGQPQRFTIDPQAHTWTAPNNRRGDIPPKLGITFTGAREMQPRRG